MGSGLPPRGCSIAYCNLRREEGEPAEYGPYLPHDDIYHQYHEGRPDPAGHGFERNILEQLDRCKELGHTLVEQDNPDLYPLYAVLRGLDLAQQRGLGVVAKNPGLLKDGALDYVAHQNVFGIIVEKDCGTPEEMDALRRRANKPDLPVWFVSFGDGRSWAREAAQDIQVAGTPIWASRIPAAASTAAPKTCCRRRRRACQNQQRQSSREEPPGWIRPKHKPFFPISDSSIRRRTARWDP